MSTTLTVGEEMTKKAKRKTADMIGFYASEELAERVRKRAEVERRSVSQWVRLRIEDALVREERGQYETAPEKKPPPPPEKGK